MAGSRAVEPGGGLLVGALVRSVIAAQGNDRLSADGLEEMSAQFGRSTVRSMRRCWWVYTRSGVHLVHHHCSQSSALTQNPGAGSSGFRATVF